MQWLWTVLSPIFWLCSVLLNPWVAASLLGVITTAGVAFRRLKPAKQLSSPKSPTVSVVTNQHEVIKGILQVFPIHPTNGWALTSVVNSVNVFSRAWDIPSSPRAPDGFSWKVFASSVILECPPDVALTRSINHKDLPLWVEGLSLPGSQVMRTSPEKDGDLIQLTFAKKDSGPPGEAWLVDALLLKSAVATLSGYLGTQVTSPMEPSIETLSRFWYSKPGLHYLHTVPRDPSSLPYHWSALLFTGIRDSKNVCLATFVMLPRQQRQSHVTTMIANQLCALRQHMVMKNLKVYPSSHRPSRPPPLVDNQAPPTRTSTTSSTQSVPAAAPSHHQNSVRSRRNLSEPTISSNNNRHLQSSRPVPREIPSTTPPPPPPRDSRDTMYLEMAKEKADKLVGIALATERDGWVMMSNKQGVCAMKLPPKEGGSPLNCVKGTGLVNVPPKFVMHFLKDTTYTLQLDDMLKEARIMHVISPAVQIVHMLYKGVWPTAPRDFGVLNISGERDNQTWLSAAISVEDSRIPNEKGYVRGRLECGGYVVRAVPGNPNVSEVTYVAQVDLKGSIPTMVTNKIADSQPQCVNKLRGIVEPLYARLSQSPQALAEYREKFPVAMIVEGVESTDAQVHPSQSQPTPPDESIPLSHITENGLLGRQNSLFQDDLVTPDSSSHNGPLTSSQQEGSVQSGPRTVSQREGSLQSSIQTSLQREESVQSGIQTSIRREESVRSGSQTSLSREGSVQSSSQIVLQREGSAQSGLRPSSPSPASPVAMETVNEDELQFQTPHFSENVIPTPCLVQRNREGESPPREQANESLETYTPEEIPSDIDVSEPSDAGGVGVISLVREGPRAYQGRDNRGGGVTQDGGESSGSGGSRESGGSSDGREGSESRESNVFVYSPSPRLELKLPQYPRPRASSDGVSSEDSVSNRQSWATHSLTLETIGYPRQGSGGVDFKTMANHTAARVLEEVFHVSGIDLNDPMTFVDQTGGWKFVGFEKDVLMLSKKHPDSPFDCFIGKGVIDLPPQTVYDSIRNPQLRFTYDNLLKELHIVQQIEEGLYILHMQHETTQCFVKQARDFCLLVSERSEPNKKLLIGTSIEVPECPPKPDIHRGKVLCSGWVVEPYRGGGKLQTEITYLLQVDMGGVPSSLVNFISRRQPLAVAYLRDYLISTSLDLSHKEDKDTSL